MAEKSILPSLEGWEKTRDTLHAYSKVAAVPARVLAEPHPKWWHLSLMVTSEGLLTNPMSHNSIGDRELRIFLNLNSHSLEVLTNGDLEQSLDLRDGYSATDMGSKLEDCLSGLGIEVELPKDKYADENPRDYDPEHSRRYLSAINFIDEVMKSLRSNLKGECSPVQLWPHHFDLAFEWFGSKTVSNEENEEHSELSAQLNFGFAPGDASFPDPYFYSNPWPFEQALTGEPLPHGARWFSDGFEGTLLPYRTLVGDEEAARKLLDYYRRVFELAKPTLMD
jgi:hypothetical protein